MILRAHNKKGELFFRVPWSPTISPDGVLTLGVFDVYQVSQEVSGTLGARSAS
jgi:hypothetical protein